MGKVSKKFLVMTIVAVMAGSSIVAYSSNKQGVIGEASVEKSVGDLTTNLQIGKSMEIPFISSLTQKGVKIHKVVATVEGEQIRFIVQYESDVDRFYSFFNPPKGTSMMQKGDLPATEGMGKVEFTIAQATLEEVEEITMKFYNYEVYKENEANQNFICLDTECVKMLLKGNTDEGSTDPIGEASNIRFKERMKQEGIKIHQVTGTAYEEEIAFKIQYESEIDRNYSFFNPPKGNQLSKKGRLPATEGIEEIVFVIPKADLEKAKEISMKFYNYQVYNTEVDNRNFIFLEMDDIEAIVR